MKRRGLRVFKSCASLLLVLCMMLSVMPVTALAAENEGGEKPIVYVSIGDSMTNGYCLDGYDGTSGAVNYGIETYSNKFAAQLAGYTGPITNDQVIFQGTNGTVDHRQLSISGLRSQDIQWILEMDYQDDALMQDVFNSDYNGTGWNANTWYNTWGFYGDRYTWSEYADYDYRYADAAARILHVYNDLGGTGAASAFRSSYADNAAIQNAMNGIAADPYYPQGKTQSNEIGGYKYLQIATEFYQESMKDADIISLAVGNTNFGTHMLSNIMDVVMDGDTSFSTQFSMEQAYALAAQDPFAETKVNAMVKSAEFDKILEACMSLAGGNAAKAQEIAYIVEYCMVSFITGYIGMLNSILELNPDAEIIQIALINAYEDPSGAVIPGTLGELVDVIYSPVNQLLEELPADLMASKSTKDQQKYANATFYFAEADHVSCMVDVFGDDYYSKDGSFVEYPGLLTGTEGYTANYNSIVRDRFVEEIVYGDMIFAALGMAPEGEPTPEDIDNFLQGAVPYDMMTLTEKAMYAAQNAEDAKAFALYLAFENSLIRSGTESVTMESLAGLSDIEAVFAAFYPEVLAAIGAARPGYYSAVAPVIVAGSNGALSEEQVLTIMDAYEQVKAAVWNGFADYHAVIKSATGHSTIEHVINCDTCMDDGGHGDGVTEQLVATYKEQMALLPYNVVAEAAKDQTGGLLDGADIKRLCEAADYEAEVYQLIAEKSNGSLTAEQVKTLVATDDGVWVVADEVTGGQYGASLIKMAYENGMLDEEQNQQIETLISVREAVLALLAKDESGNFTTKAAFADNAAGIQSAIDGAAQLAYLLALPQAMSDTLYNDSNMQGALCMNARCLLGTGAGGHPSVGGHTSLYNAIMQALENPSVYIPRLCGDDRVKTAIEVADELKAVLGRETFDTIIIANGNNFADALTGSYLATVKEAPILLYRANGVALNEAYIADNLSENGIIYILGGTSAVPADVEESLNEAGYNLQRLYGDTRYETNLKILEAAGVTDEEILICTGTEYADSLAASATGLPILMVNVNADELLDSQVSFLEQYADNSFTIIGGSMAVSEKLEADIEAIVGEVDRINGSSREETSVKVAERYFENPEYVLVAYSRNFPDGLCGGPLAHAMNAPLLLVNSGKEAAAAAYVAENGIADGFILGGTAVVSNQSVKIIFGN